MLIRARAFKAGWNQAWGGVRAVRDRVSYQRFDGHLKWRRYPPEGGAYCDTGNTSGASSSSRRSCSWGRLARKFDSDPNFSMGVVPA